MKHPRRWNRLDNASVLFPPNSSKKDTKVFRFICELKEEIDPEILTAALARTVKQFPLFLSVMRQGVFWHYLEESKFEPKAVKEYKPPASQLYHREYKSPLFEVTYYKRRINVEVFHALADGTGALYFFRTLVLYYLLEKYPDHFQGDPPELEYNASLSQKMSDGFQKYYEKTKIPRRIRPRKAFRIHGLRNLNDDLGVIEGRFSASAFSAKIKDSGSTMGQYLTAVLIYAIHNEMSLRDEQFPVVISVPVNLRNFFPEESARNFFGVITIDHNFRDQGKSFEEILKQVQISFKERLSEENIKKRMNALMALQESSPTKFVPLVLKDPILRFAGSLADKEVTAGISNLGKVQMPEQVKPYIHAFSVFNSTKKIQLCLCTFEDTLSVSFTSPFISTDVQRCFFRKLTDLGLEIDIISNLTEVNDEDPAHEM